MTNPETGPSKKMRLTLTETNDCDKPTRMNDEEKKLLENIRKIMNKAAELTQERAITHEKYRAFLAAEASLKKKLKVEKIEEDVDAVFSSVAAEFGGESNKENVVEDRTALMDDDWIVIDGIVDWEALARS